MPIHTIANILGPIDVMSASHHSEPQSSSAPTAVDHELSRRLDQLTLATMAMWELIRDQTALSENDLLDKMQEIDLRDGKADGKLVSGIKTCKACNRPVNPRHKKCLYCGAELQKDSAFDGAL